MPDVTILLPVYNCEQYIARAVDSILAQTFGDFELLIVDDGSTDSTPAILARWDDPRIRIIRQANGGIVAALTAGLAAADGSSDFLARMDADDIAYPTRLERQVQHMRANPDCVLLGSWVHILCPAGLVLFTKQVPTQHEEIARAVWAGDSQAVIHPAAMIRREALVKIGGYRREYSTIEDLDIYLRLSNCGRFANIPEPLLGYRQHPSSTNAVHFERQVKLMRALIAELEPMCPYEALDRPLLNGWEILCGSQFLRRCGWNALKHNDPRLARRYAAMAVRQAPLDPEAWQLAWCAVRGH